VFEPMARCPGGDVVPLLQPVRIALQPISRLTLHRVRSFANCSAGQRPTTYYALFLNTLYSNALRTC
jgi:hypothetical protein